MQEKNLTGRKLHIEFLRIVAAFLVIVNHTNSRIFLGTQPSALWLGSVSYFFVSKIAVPVFLMIMGAVLLSKQDSYKKYFSRIVRIAVAVIVFSTMMYLYYGGTNILIGIREIFNSTHPPYWYLYMYLGLLLILPFMQKIAQTLDKKEMQMLLFVTVAIGGVAPMLQNIGFTVHDAFFYGLFSPYVGLVFAGYYVEKHMNITPKTAVISAVAFVALVAAQVLVTLKSYYSRNGVDYLWLDDAKFLPITASAVCFYIVIKYIFANTNLFAKQAKAVCFVGGLTFGVYLMADLAMMTLSPVYKTMAQSMPVMVAMIIFQVAIFVGAALLTAILKCIPLVKKLL